MIRLRNRLALMGWRCGRHVCAALVLSCFAAGRAAADEIILTEGLVMTGSVQKAELPAKVMMKVPWSESPVSVEAGHIWKISFSGAGETFASDLVVDMANGSQFPCKLVQLGKDRVVVNDASGQKVEIPFTRMAALRFGAVSKALFSSAGGWDLGKWKGAKTNWTVKDGCLRRSNMSCRDEGLIEVEFPEGLDSFTASMSVMSLGGGVILLGRDRADKAKTIGLTLESEECPGLVTMRMEPDEARDRRDFFVPSDNVDLRIERDASSVDVLLNGVTILSGAIPPGAAPAFGIHAGEAGDMAILECIVRPGKRLKKLPAAPNREDLSIYLTQGDIMSVKEFRPVDDKIELEVLGTKMTIPLARIAGIRFPAAVSSDATTTPGRVAEMAVEGMIVGRGELAAISEKYVSIKDASGTTYSFPRTCGTAVYWTVGAGRCSTPQEVIDSVSKAMVAMNLPQFAECFLWVPDDLLEAFEGEKGKRVKRLDIKPKDPAALGRIARVEARVLIESVDRDGDVEKETEDMVAYVLRHRGRWYVQIQEK